MDGDAPQSQRLGQEVSVICAEDALVSTALMVAGKLLEHAGIFISSYFFLAPSH